MDTIEHEVNRQVLLYGVQRQIMCQHTGKILDVRTAVMVTIKTPAQTVVDVMDPGHYDTIADAVAKVCEAKGYTLEVVDGRQL